MELGGRRMEWVRGWRWWERWSGWEGWEDEGERKHSTFSCLSLKRSSANIGMPPFERLA